jgi:hypothetical protein
LPPSVCGIFRSGLSSNQMNTLSGVTACYIAVYRPHPYCCWELLVGPYLERVVADQPASGINIYYIIQSV